MSAVSLNRGTVAFGGFSDSVVVSIRLQVHCTAMRPLHKLLCDTRTPGSSWLPS